MSYQPNRQPFDLVNVIAALAILGVNMSGGVGVHTRRLQTDKTLTSNQYIVAPTSFIVEAGVTLTVGTDAELKVV